MTSKLSPALAVVLGTITVLPTEAALGDSLIDEKQLVDWHEQSTDVRLPPPFGSVTITVRKDRKEVERVLIKTDADEIDVPEELLNGIFLVTDQEMTYDRADFEKDERLQQFQVSLEYGYPELVHAPEVPGCGSPCLVSFRDIAIFTINDKYEITRETMQAEDIAPATAMASDLGAAEESSNILFLIAKPQSVTPTRSLSGAVDGDISIGDEYRVTLTQVRVLFGSHKAPPTTVKLTASHRESINSKEQIFLLLEKSRDSWVAKYWGGLQTVACVPREFIEDTGLESHFAGFERYDDKVCTTTE